MPSWQCNGAPAHHKCTCRLRHSRIIFARRGPWLRLSHMCINCIVHFECYLQNNMMTIPGRLAQAYVRARTHCVRMQVCHDNEQHWECRIWLMCRAVCCRVTVWLPVYSVKPSVFVKHVLSQGEVVCDKGRGLDSVAWQPYGHTAAHCHANSRSTAASHCTEAATAAAAAAAAT